MIYVDHSLRVYQTLYPKNKVTFNFSCFFSLLDKLDQAKHLVQILEDLNHRFKIFCNKYMASLHPNIGKFWKFQKHVDISKN